MGYRHVFSDNFFRSEIDPERIGVQHYEEAIIQDIEFAAVQTGHPIKDEKIDGKISWVHVVLRGRISPKWTDTRSGRRLLCWWPVWIWKWLGGGGGSVPGCPGVSRGVPDVPLVPFVPFVPPVPVWVSGTRGTNEIYSHLQKSFRQCPHKTIISSPI
jgi:hypothetical protein